MDSIRIGILHPTPQSMDGCGSDLVDAVLMAVDEINQSGGVLGWPVQAVIADGGSELDSFRTTARYLLEDQGIKQVFGGWTSDVRKAIIPIFEATNSLLWYPFQYEGVELSRHVLYGGACPNQQVEPAISWLLDQGKRKFYLLGSDFVFPRLTNKVVRAQLSRQGGQTIGESYIALRKAEFAATIADIQQRQPDVVFSTLNKDSETAFYLQYAAAGMTADQIPIMSASMTEQELALLGQGAVGHYAVAGYFHGLQTRESQSFSARFQARYGAERRVSDLMATAYSQVFLWRRAAESAESFKVDDIRVAAYGEQFESPFGTLAININHHASRPCFIGQASERGQFEIVEAQTEPIEPLPWLGVETVDVGNGPVVIDMLAQVGRSMQQTWELEQKSLELEQTAYQLQAEMLERHRAEEESRLLFDISQTMAEAQDFESAMASAIAHVCRVTCWPYGEVWMPEEKGERLGATPIWLLDEALVTEEDAAALKLFREDSQKQSFALGEELLGRVWAQGEAEWVEYFQGWGAVAVPILASNHGSSALFETTSTSNRVLAILIFLQPEARSEDTRLVRLISTVAAQLGGALQQKQAERALRYKNEELVKTLSQLKTAQEELVHSEKMVALGQLVAGVAHEINTPLGAICSSAEYISGFLAEDLLELPGFFLSLSSVKRQFFGYLLRQNQGRSALLSSRERRKRRRSLQQSLDVFGIADSASLSDELVAIQPECNIEALLPLLQEPGCLDFLRYMGRLLELRNSGQDITIAADRASKVVFALKTYARYDHQGELRQANMEESLETILTLYQNKLKHGIDIQRCYGGVPSISCYPDELNQVWMNLIHNAIQAMGEKGELGVQTRHEQDWIRVSISDSGCGISEAVQARMFEPFFTTKPPGEGSGLGLDIVKKIVNKHGGKIDVTSQPGNTTFTVSLPMAMVMTACSIPGEWSQKLDETFTSRPARSMLQGSASSDLSALNV